ncbi:hypothetical protein [Sporomusa acidovorans]|uniref:hypothetical protein n=1 Tax=Sporomusa acidovorans TaxID=112900 RepID=UPI0011604CCA|nr:hypothetical protein [Sporomusa acidovorans]
MAIIGIDGVVNTHILTGDVGIFAADNRCAFAGTLTLPAIEPTALPISSLTCSFKVVVVDCLPMVKPRPPPLKRPDFLLFRMS